MMNETEPQPETISRLLDAVYPSFAMLAGMELELFTALEGGPLGVKQIAEAVGVRAVKLRPLLYALVVAGLLNVNHELFSNTIEASQFLVRGKPAYMGGMHELTSNNWSRIIKTAATLRAGGPLAEYDYHAGQDELVELFRGFHPGAIHDAHRLMDRHDFSAYRSLLDVGGGSGGLAITIAQVNPNLKATVLELPSITPITQQFIEEASAGARVDIKAGDAVRDRLTGSYDVVVARHVIQVLSDADSRALLRNISAAIRPSGVLFIVGWILDDSRLAPEKTVGYNLVLLNGYEDGQAYTESEYFAWLDEAGFAEFERFAMSDGASILTARKLA